MNFKNIIGAIAAVAALCSAQISSAQSFEGKMTMKIEYEEVPEEIEPYVGMLPKETTMYIKGKKSCTVQNMMGGSNSTIMDSETGKGFIVMDMMGKKDAYEMSKEDMDKSNAADKKPVITYSDETKTIAGYSCKKAELKYEGIEDAIVVWYTEEIIGGFNSQYQDLKGQPMEYSVNANGMVMTMTVASVTKESVSDSKFEVPEGYTVKPYSDMMKMGGDK